MLLTVRREGLMSDAETRPSGAMCPVCGGNVSPQSGSGRPRRYCSSACKSAAMSAAIRRPFAELRRPAVMLVSSCGRVAG